MIQVINNVSTISSLVNEKGCLCFLSSIYLPSSLKASIDKELFYLMWHYHVWQVFLPHPHPDGYSQAEMTYLLFSS
ncbi:hypothetical protein Hanom_Chr06g00527001 [Helianthus anomalus]